MTENYCQQLLYAGSPTQPYEFCDELAEPNEDYCPAHLPLHDDRADEYWSLLKEGLLD